jgi:anti-sigma regulatory factor (Ser/Thr protein kinase)
VGTPPGVLGRDRLVDLEMTADGPRAARAFLSDALVAWDQEHHAGTAALLVSELVTNAIVHAHSPVELRVTMLDTTIRVEVRDDSDAAPQILPPGPEPGGYGLSLVDALAHDWGYELLAGDGKRVWFELEAT